MLSPSYVSWGATLFIFDPMWNSNLYAWTNNKWIISITIYEENLIKVLNFSKKFRTKKNTVLKENCYSKHLSFMINIADTFFLE